MPKVTVRCDTCGELVRGSINPSGFTGGFYLRGWLIPPAAIPRPTQDSLFEEKENIVCDFCMQSTPTYQKLYGERALETQRLHDTKLEEGEVARSYSELMQFIKTGGRTYNGPV